MSFSYSKYKLIISFLILFETAAFKGKFSSFNLPVKSTLQKVQKVDDLAAR